MNFKKFIYATLAVVLTIGLAACGGSGGDSGTPNQTTQYGQLGVVTQLDFHDVNQQQPNIPSALQAGLSTAINTGNNIALLADSQPAGLGFTVGNIASNAASMDIDHINAYAITYNTPGVAPQTNPADVSREVSGLVLVPTQASGSIINNPKGIIVVYHQTEFAKNSVPSCLTSALITNTPGYCNNPQHDSGADGDNYFWQLGAVYAAAGYIVVAPDYIGEGIDNSIVHPYVLYPQVDADSGLYMVGAARTLLAQENFLPKSVPLNLFITGFSEGGAYALNASQQAQTQLSSYLASQNVNLIITAPAEGAYDVLAQMQFSFADLMDGVTYCGLNGTTPNPCNPPYTLTKNFWKIGSTEDAAFAKPLLIALSLTTMGYYALNNNSVLYQLLMKPSFFNVPNASPAVTLAQLFSSPAYSNLQIAGLVTNDGYSQMNNGLPYGGGLSASGQNNSISAFTSTSIQSNPLVTKMLTAANTYQWTTTSPIDFIHLNYDSVVAIANYDTAYQYMSSNLVSQTTIANDSIANTDCQTSSNPQIFCQASPSSNVNIPIDHDGAGPFMYIGALCAFEHAQGFTNICS